ncbi:MAG TPA: tetratricopeptide repeat protein [Terriglobia bacterium]|nr:tetratricopeptide repeat protein [Terriglobia bacterium]
MRPLPAQRVPCGIEQYVDGSVQANRLGEYFVARQVLPFGRPYGRLRVGDVSVSDLSALEIFLGGQFLAGQRGGDALPDPSELIYLDTETTGLAGGTGTCAFLIGVGAIEGSDFVVRQFFLRDYPEERAVLAALADLLAGYKGLVTFNGKTFDVPLLETRFRLARQRPPFGRMIHLDLLHPARQLWKLRLESCRLTHLEAEILGVGRSGDVDGADIPGIYFDYLRSGDARGLQPVFYHNALDIVTLAALTSELARIIRTESARGVDVAQGEIDAAKVGTPGESMPGLDLFSLSRIFERAGDRARAATVCRRALDSGLPDSLEPRALWHLATQHRRSGEFEQAAEIWLEITRRETDYFLDALEQLAIHAEHRQRDAAAALQFTERALGWIGAKAGVPPRDGSATDWQAWSKLERRRELERFRHRLDRLKRKTSPPISPPLL